MPENNDLDVYEELNDLISLYYNFNINSNFFENGKIVKPNYLFSCQDFINNSIEFVNTNENIANPEDRKVLFLTMIEKQICEKMSYSFSVDIFSKIIFFKIMSFDNLMSLIQDNSETCIQPVVISETIKKIQTFYNPFFVIQPIVTPMANKDNKISLSPNKDTSCSIKEKIQKVYNSDSKLYNSKIITKKILNIIDNYILGICNIIEEEGNNDEQHKQFAHSGDERAVNTK